MEETVRTFIIALVLLSPAPLGAPAEAQTFPSRPVTLVVPLATGGSTDTIGRIMADGMRTSLGQPVIVENTSGAGGTIGVGRVVRSAPDGYTLLIGQWGTNVATGAVYNLQFDLLTDLEPVGLIATQPFMIVGKKDLPANNLKELIAWLKANANNVSVGTAGVGAAGHVAGVFFQNTIGSRFQFVPYRSAGLAIRDLVAGQIDMNLDTPATSGPLVRNGLIKAYAVTAKTRSPVIPEVPSVDEAGLPGFYFGFWHAIWMPKGTSKDAVAKVNAALKAALADPVVGKRLADIGQEIYPPDRRTPEALAVFQKAEIEKWWPIIKAAGIKAQ
jgi:tripartite-type tricarboxylate transporter receptor subunit TctC